MVIVIEQDKLLWLVTLVSEKAFARQWPVFYKAHVTDAFSAFFVIPFLHCSFFKAKKHRRIRAAFGKSFVQ